MLPEHVFADPQKTVPAIYFEEVLWAGSDRSTSDEWFELKSNLGSVTTLDGWRVEGASSKPIDLTGYQIPAHGSLLVSHFDQHHVFSNGKESALAIDPDVLQTSLMLSNTALKLSLYDGPDLIDVAGNGKTPLKGSSKTGAISSMERIMPVGSGDVISSWQSAISASNLDNDSNVLANPKHAGRPNILTSSLLPQPAQKIASIEIQINDPDGEDDVSTVSFTCHNKTYPLVDNGLAGDLVAGDRTYTALVQTGNSVSENCTASVVDRSQLSQQQSIALSTYVADAPVFVNEIYPMPDIGEDEFIELKNSGENVIQLNGWLLDDSPTGGSQPYSLDGYSIPAHGFLTLYKKQTGIALNDDGDHAVLKTPTGIIKNDIIYGSAKRGQSWGLNNNLWEWETPTPGSENQPAISTNQSPFENYPIMSVKDFKALASGSQASLSGEVVALPGMLGAQYLLLADSSGTSQIYLYDKSFPQLALGDLVSASGVRSSASYPRLIIQTGGAFQKSISSFNVLPVDLVQVLNNKIAADTYASGKVTLTKRNSRTLAVEASNGQSLTIEWPETDSASNFDSALASGDQISVTGIVANADSNEPTMILRSASDIVLISSNPSQIETTIANSVGGSATLKQAAQKVITKITDSIRPALETELSVAELSLSRTLVSLKYLQLSQAAMEVGSQIRILALRRWIRLNEYAILTLLVFLITVLIIHEAKRFDTFESSLDPPQTI